MLSATRKTKACEITRKITVGQWADVDGELITDVAVVETRHLKTKDVSRSAYYRIRRILNQIGGIGLEVEKVGPDNDIHHIHLGRPGDSCDCEAGTYRGECRHLEMVRGWPFPKNSCNRWQPGPATPTPARWRINDESHLGRDRTR